ncbi:hypothetical protein SAMN02927900_01292 [Rhizobium mongolense subsp. loessense]|uniref:Uncharacterized protein n=1 Tax=Rhizobium mongolense subsp. loessense TaxID=158890 RepID=A0A1G4Q393_9HYPH|nr:hypothetical protein [Rhizobium mongolense]SCW39046.1 hypothetical protein SAMN02927900_01292 [Rhizobium mongolense subsp. loessense]
MADKLQIWKQALVHLEKTTITTLTDDVEAVYTFGAAWPGVVEEAFNAGDWNFAKVSAALALNGTETPAIGWTYVFDYPDDWMRTVAVNNRPEFRSPFRDYADEGGFLHANTNILYLRYISRDRMADDQIGDWPSMFWKYVAVKLAFDTCGRLTAGDTLEQKLEKRLDKALRQAKSVDARNENNKVIAPGSWLRSRFGAGCGPFGGANGGTLVGGEITFEEGDV